MDIIPDHDPQETQEWLAALDGVLAAEGADRAHFLIEALIDKARRSGTSCARRCWPSSPPSPSCTPRCRSA